GLTAGHRSDVEEQRLAPRRVLRAAIGDDPDRIREDLGERGADLRADVDGDVVARLEIGRRPDVRNAVRPDEDLAARAQRERLVLALADERLEREVVSAGDADPEGARARG